MLGMLMYWMLIADLAMLYTWKDCNFERHLSKRLNYLHVVVSISHGKFNWWHVWAIKCRSFCWNVVRLTFSLLHDVVLTCYCMKPWSYWKKACVLFWLSVMSATSCNVIHLWTTIRKMLALLNEIWWVCLNIN